MQRLSLVIVLLLFGCDSKERYEAKLVAPKSGIRASVRSAVAYRDAETLEAIRGYSQITICPVNGRPGNTVELEAIVDERDNEGNPVFKLLSKERVFRWSWSDDSALTELLVRNGYSSLDSSETKRLNHVLFNSLSSAKGFVLKGQGQEIEVLAATIDYHPTFDETLPPNKWMAARDRMACGSF